MGPVARGEEGRELAAAPHRFSDVEHDQRKHDPLEDVVERKHDGDAAGLGVGKGVGIGGDEERPQNDDCR